jgi:hypothetical protein
MVDDDAARQLRLEMGDVGFLGGPVDDEVEMVAAPGRHQVVEDAGILGEQQRVAQPAFLEDPEVGGKQGLEPLFRVGAGDDQLAHMADVEQTGALARPAMLGDDPLILDRHRIAGERDHPRAAGDMPVVQRKNAVCGRVAHVQSLQGVASTSGPAGSCRKLSPSVTGPESFPRRRRGYGGLPLRWPTFARGFGGRFPECHGPRGPSA